MNKDLDIINKHVERNIDLFKHLQKQLEERRVDSVESEWYNKGRADSFGFAAKHLEEVLVVIKHLKEINNDFS